MIRRMAIVKQAGEVVFEESTIPELRENEVLIKTSYSSVCGSDLHLYHDTHPFAKAPSAIGHELSGRVVAAGSAVKSLAVGDLVAPEPVLVCGICDYCMGGNYHMCQHISFQYRRGQSGFADYFIADERWAHKVPDHIGDKAAALIEPLAVAIHGVRKAGDLLAKSTLVIGAGAIGTLTAHVSKVAGASKVTIVDPNENRLRIAERLSGAKGVHVNGQDAGTGFDVVFECTGLEVCARDAIEAVKKLGVIVQIGISKQNFSDYPYARLLQKEITLRGSQAYCFDFERAIELLSSGVVDVTPYITHEFHAEQLGQAFDLASLPDTDSMKILVSYK